MEIMKTFQKLIKYDCNEKRRYRIANFILNARKKLIRGLTIFKIDGSTIFELPYNYITSDDLDYQLFLNECRELIGFEFLFFSETRIHPVTISYRPQMISFFWFINQLCIIKNNWPDRCLVLNNNFEKKNACMCIEIS